MATVVIPASASAGASWEDQIVPTLRKRLEHESAYISNRLSSNNFQDGHRDSPSPSPSLSSGAASVPFPSSTEAPPTSVAVSRIPTSPRSRTKSTFAPPRQTFNVDTSATAGPSSPPVPIPGISPQPTSGDVSGLPPSRIPSRPRSKSQLAPRPTGLERTNSKAPPPVPTSMTRPPNSRRGSSTNSRPVSTRGRSGSPELTSARITEGLVKNELPPFVLHPEDAMRIAERGHDLRSDTENEDGYGGSGRDERNALSRSVGGLDDRGGRRQRTITMGPESRSSFDDPAGRPFGASGSRIGTVGLGVPSTSLRKSATNRSASSRTPQAGGTSTGHAPRSASMNLIASPSMGTPSSASSSRLGVAAHFVPPENTYTPPKGANWDEVVLPTVAKKLGINEPGRPEGEDGDLAVEWDRDGTPIKWVKRGALSTSHSSQFPLRDVNDNTSPSPSAFSPTFEPSPNNPLRHQPSLHAPSMRHKKSGESFELRPIRAGRGQYADLECEPPESPAPFANLAPAPPGYVPTMHRYNSDTSTPNLSRKPSLLQRVTGQASQRSLRSAAAGQTGPDVFGGHGQGGSSGHTERFGRDGYGPGAAGQTGSWRPESAWDQSRSGPHGFPSSRQPAGVQSGTGHSEQPGGPVAGGQRPPAKKHDDTVGKGCGCVIM